MENILDYCTISGESVKKYEGTKRYVATGDVIENKIINSSEVDYMNKPSRANQIAKVGDLLFAKMKETKKVIKIDEENSKNIYSTGFCVIRPNEGILTDYIYWVLNSPKFNRDKDRNCKGATQKALNNDGLKKIKINKIPDIVEQQKIVSKLNKINKIITKKKKQLNILDELVKSQFVEMFGNIYFNDRKWNKNKWGDVLIIKNGKNQKKVESFNGKYPIYGSGGIIGFANDYICNENSIIIGRKGSINKPILVKTKFWNVDTAFGLEPIKEKIKADYLYYFCCFYNFEKHNKAVTIPSLTKKDLLNIVIPVPPITLQNQFAEIVKQIDKQKFEIEKSLKEIQELYESLIEEYFNKSTLKDE